MREKNLELSFLEQIVLLGVGCFYCGKMREQEFVPAGVKLVYSNTLEEHKDCKPNRMSVVYYDANGKILHNCTKKFDKLSYT